MKKIALLFISAALVLSLCSCSGNVAIQSDNGGNNVSTKDSKNSSDISISAQSAESSNDNTDESSTVSIDECDINAADIVYDGENSRPPLTVSLSGKQLVENTDYTLSWDNETNVGKHQLTVTMKGSYSGSETVDYYILPPASEITDTSSKVSSITINWNEVPDVDGYIIRYSEDKSLPEDNTKTAETKETSLTLENLPENSTYYFNVSTTKNIADETLVSEPGVVNEASTKKIEVIDGVTYIDGVLIANKTYSLPESFGDGLDEKTLDAFNTMAADALNDGISLWITSGFRSYETQSYTYQSFVYDRGVEEADRASARPGHSEHQTGLAIDVNTTSSAFEGTAEAIWLEEHCVKYGFIIRYPNGKEDITGYKYEPWHIRYVGKEKAAEIAASGLTIEEYYGITSHYS